MENPGRKFNIMNYKREMIAIAAGLVVAAVTAPMFDGNHSSTNDNRKEEVSYQYLPAFTDTFINSKGKPVNYAVTGTLLEKIHEPNGQVEYFVARRNISESQAKSIEHSGVLQP